MALSTVKSFTQWPVVFICKRKWIALKFVDVAVNNSLANHFHVKQIEISNEVIMKTAGVIAQSKYLYDIA